MRAVAAFGLVALAVFAGAQTVGAGPFSAQPPPRKPVPSVSALPGKVLPRVLAVHDAAFRARLEARCTRWRLIWGDGFECRPGDGSSRNAADPMREVRRLPLRGRMGQ